MSRNAGSFRFSLQDMSEDLKSRFQSAIQLEAMDLDSTYVLATALDPRYKNGLSTEQLSIAKKYLLHEVF